jgi:hypothetical protein
MSAPVRPWYACTGAPCICPKPDVDPRLLAELDGVPGADAPRVELANIRRLLERHGIPPADGHGVIRSTVGMVEEALIARPPSP